MTFKISNTTDLTIVFFHQLYNNSKKDILSIVLQAHIDIDIHEEKKPTIIKLIIYYLADNKLSLIEFRLN